MSLPLFYLLAKVISLLAATLVTISDKMMSGDTVIPVLAFSCFFLTDYLLSTRKKPKRIPCIIINILSVIPALIIGINCYIYVLLFTAIEIVELLTEGKYFYQISAIITVILMFILSPKPLDIVISIILCGFFLFSRIVFTILENTREMLRESRKEIASNKEKINNLVAYTKTVKEAAALEERSRFSVRIHDQLGHGISGSILLLEAAKLSIKTNPEQAEKCIETATENLRNGVDSIRKSLRQERPDIKSVGMAEIKEILDKYKAEYNFETALNIEGDTDTIPFTIWNCIRDNLIESMTNTLKHSQANRFSLKIAIMNKLVRVEYADNGKPSGKFTKGMGLTAIEERTEQANGKCLFLQREDGFHTVNLFKL